MSQGSGVSVKNKVDSCPELRNNAKEGDLSRRTDKDKDPANVETQPTTISGFGDHSELNIFGRKRKQGTCEGTAESVSEVEHKPTSAS